MDTPKLIDINGVFTIEYRSKYLYSKKDPLRIEKVVSQFAFKENTLYIFPSPLLYYGYEIIQDKLPESSIIIFIEVDDSLYSLKPSGKQLDLISTGFDFLRVLNRINLSSIRNCEILPLTGGYSLYKGVYDRLHKITLTTIQNYWQNRITQINLGQLWVKNLIINSGNILKHSPLSSLSISCPILVVGAGESLEKALPFIRLNSKKLYILCVDTALESLLQAGIVPDGVIALESQFYNLPDFYGAKGLNIDLIYDLTSYPGVVRNLRGNKFFTLTKFEESSIIKKFESAFPESTLPPLGSVGITALYIALKLTNKEIYLCGLDFSYKFDKSHSRGTPYHLSSITSITRTKGPSNFSNSIKRPLIYKSNKKGEIELTDKILYEFSLRTRELLEGNPRVFDLTNQGLPITTNILDSSLVIFDNPKEKTIKEFTKNINLREIILDDVNYMLEQFKNYFSESISFSTLLMDIRKKEYLFNYMAYRESIDKENIKNVYYSFIRLKKRSGIK